MAEEIVYADLRFPPESNAVRLPHPSQGSNASQSSCWYQLALWIGWGSSAILLVTVIVLVFQVRQPLDPLTTDCHCLGPANETENNLIPSHLKEYLCKPLYNSITEKSSCSLCPQNWNLHENKCYWISKERQTWHKSMEDCTAKHSQLLVIENQEEVAFIQSIMEGAQLLWIGLNITFPERNWTWLDGSPLDDKLFQELGPVEVNFCGRLNGNQIISEDCNTISMWVCETAALLL